MGSNLTAIAGAVDARLWVIGTDAPPEIFESPRMIVTGHMPRVDDFFRHARVFVSPLRYGRGMKGKNGQAMAYGLPSVTTSVRAVGMDLRDGEHALIRDDPNAFASAVIELYSQRELWERLSRTARGHVRERWSPEAMRTRLEELLAGVRTAAPRAPGAGQPARALRR